MYKKVFQKKKRKINVGLVLRLGEVDLEDCDVTAGTSPNNGGGGGGQ
ncbi:hypothetical protein HRED_07671 [Candidatus Haloredivivus sp. G17]|nr:hypothetical protein HRED_07671 [Candidatus Haloredivivus sp. G17]